MSPLERQGDIVFVPLPPGEEGYIGRTCPNSECKKYFKILPRSELEGDAYCPYCGHKGDIRTFPTMDQVKYAASHVIREAMENFSQELKKLQFDSKSSGTSGFSFSMRFEPGEPYPIHSYKEEDLETYIQCSNCQLKYAVYGVFGFCPVCGQHNSLQILQNNLNLVQKMMGLATLADAEMSVKVVENALEDCISAFDGFGRELCRIHTGKSKFPERINKISFQSLDGAKEGINSHFGFDLDTGISNEEWKIANISFQKRHLLAHKMGIIDEEYVKRSGDTTAIIGRKIVITSDDVISLIPIIEKLAEFLVESMNKVSNEVAGKE